MPTFHLGQPCVVSPKTFNISPYGHEQPTKCEIVYIHPRMRYVTVAVEMPGGTIRESFFPDEVQLIEKKRKR